MAGSYRPAFWYRDFMCQKCFGEAVSTSYELRFVRVTNHRNLLDMLAFSRDHRTYDFRELTRQEILFALD
jgi:hypothetical protein